MTLKWCRLVGGDRHGSSLLHDLGLPFYPLCGDNDRVRQTFGASSGFAQGFIRFEAPRARAGDFVQLFF